MSKDLEDYKVKGAEVLSCPPDKSPIFFVNVKGEIRNNLKSKKFLTYWAKKIVVKGTLEEIKKSDQTKKQFIKEFFKEDSAAKKKVHEFDLTKITITKVEIIRGLGHGIKSN